MTKEQEDALLDEPKPAISYATPRTKKNSWATGPFPGDPRVVTEKFAMELERELASENAHLEQMTIAANQLHQERDAADRACNMILAEVDSLRAALTAITRNQSEKPGEEGICPFGCDAPWIALSALGQWKDGTVEGWAKTSAENWREKSKAQSQEIVHIHAERDALRAERDKMREERDIAVANHYDTITQLEASEKRNEVAGEEFGRWQNEIRSLLIDLSGAPDSAIDGGGCDSGDPLDLTKTEIKQAFGWRNYALANACAEFRDGVLNQRGALETPCLDNDQTNAVLSAYDDGIGALLNGMGATVAPALKPNETP